MRLLRHLQHWLTGPGRPLVVTDFVPETPPLRQWADTFPWTALVAAVERSRIESVLYHDLNDPAGVALLALHEDPAFFATGLRELLHGEPFASLRHRPDLTMLGRTYASGFEPDLDSSPEKARRRLEEEFVKWAPVIKAVGLKLD